MELPVSASAERVMEQGSAPAKPQPELNEAGDPVELLGRIVRFPRRERYILESLTISLAVGLLAGLVELIVIAFFKVVLGRMVWTGWHTLWATPASYALLMSGVGLVLGLGARLRPRRFNQRLVLFLAIFVAAFSVCWLFYPMITRVAILILALGIATAAARALGSHPDFVARASRMVTQAGFVMVAILAVGVHGGRLLIEHRALAALPAPAAQMPNVLFVVMDAVRAQDLSLYGYARPTTPQLAAFATRGATFTDAWSTAPWTLPSHSSMFTGRYAHEFRDTDWERPLDADVPTLSEVLTREGYVAGGFVANMYCSRETGLSRGFLHYEDYVVSPTELILASSLGRFIALNPSLHNLLGHHELLGRKTAADIANAFLTWQTTVGDRPFFAFLNLYDAHEPYLPPDSIAAQFSGPNARRLDQIRYTNARNAERTQKPQMTPDERQAEQAAYDASIASIDTQLGRLFGELEHRGVLGKTVVVVVADHGEMFGEHQLFSHGHSLYRPLLQVPLVIVYPNSVPVGSRINSTVSLRDLPATVLALTGTPGAPLPGRSLLLADNTQKAASPVLASVRASRGLPQRYPAAKGTMNSIVDSGYEYILGADGQEALYALSDTDQTVNLATDPRARETLAKLRASLQSALRPD